MFSINSIPTVTINNQENSDTLITRKAGEITNSTRKAFQDRNVNSKIQPNIVRKTPLKINLAKVDCRTESKSPLEPTYEDYCYYKPVEDTYEDILPKQDRLSMEDILNFMSAFAKPSIPKYDELEFFNVPKLECLSSPEPLNHGFDRSEFVNLKEDIVFEELEDFNFCF